ncbi:hypothetical protein [Arcobacter sp. LA11]|uniref:hypothetical protein n=1 Tax=Arcobacter sp. LA11 TaxID=1898176 RepID=UPI000935330C|nr:hypothetical protein [Arcobacter sp. LA11]
MSELLILILAFLILAFIIYIFSKKSITSSKPAPIKKEELIKKYEDEMTEIINRYKDDSINLQQKKIEYLKLASHQLHNNIFFDAQEAKEIVKKLASL